MPSDVTGSSIFDQRTRDFEFRPGPDLHEPPARRRDQPRAAEDAGGAARGDAGAAGDDRGRDAAARRGRSSCSRPRTRSSTRAPTRCRRRSSTASCCASASATRRARTSGACSQRRLERRTDEIELEPVVDRETLLAMQRALEQVHVSESVGLYIVDVVARDAREPERPGRREPARDARAAEARRACRAALDGRDFVTPDDVKAVAVPALAHRLTLRPELWVQRVPAGGRRAGALETVPTPRRRGRRAAPGDARGRARRSSPPTPASRRSGCSAALVSGGPELAALGAPFLLVAAARRSALPRDPRVERRLTARPRARCSRARRSTLDAGAARAQRRSSGSSCSLALPTRARARRRAENPTVVCASRAASRATLELPLARRALGRYALGDVLVRARDLLGARRATSALGDRRRAAAGLPAAGGAARARCARPRRRSYAGNELSRAQGRGIEFADLRPFVAGDRVRRVNWRASARRGELWVNEQHPERNADVVLFLDTSPRRGAAPTGTLDLAVRAAARARRPLPRPARPGGARLLRRRSCAGSCPATGLVQRLPDPRRAARQRGRAELRVEGRSTSSRARMLPPQALVIALTPLLDERVGARAARPARPRLRRRGRRGLAAGVRARARRAARPARATGSGGCGARRCAARYLRGRRARRGVARRRAARGAARGGGDVPALGAARPRLAEGAAVVAGRGRAGGVRRAGAPRLGGLRCVSRPPGCASWRRRSAARGPGARRPRAGAPRRGATRAVRRGRRPRRARAALRRRASLVAAELAFGALELRAAPLRARGLALRAAPARALARSAAVAGRRRRPAPPRRCRVGGGLALEAVGAGAVVAAVVLVGRAARR